MEKTENLLKRLNSSQNVDSLSNYLDEIKSDIPNSLPDYLRKTIKDKNLSSSEVIKRSRIERTYCYQILNGRKRPGRDKLVALALAMNLSFEETQQLLSVANLGILYARSKRDSILIYAINNKMSVLDTNFLLTQYSETELR